MDMPRDAQTHFHVLLKLDINDQKPTHILQYCIVKGDVEI